MIGVLALQGAFIEHLAKFAQLGISAKEVGITAYKRSEGASSRLLFAQVRTAADLQDCHGLVIPGGESTAIGLIAERLGMVGANKFTMLYKSAPNMFALRSCNL